MKRWLMLLLILVGCEKKPSFSDVVYKKNGEFEELSVIAEEITKSLAGTPLKVMPPLEEKENLFGSRINEVYNNIYSTYLLGVLRHNSPKYLDKIIIFLSIGMKASEVDLEKMMGKMHTMMEWYNKIEPRYEKELEELYKEMNDEIKMYMLSRKYLSGEDAQEEGHKIIKSSDTDYGMSLSIYNDSTNFPVYTLQLMRSYEAKES